MVTTTSSQRPPALPRIQSTADSVSSKIDAHAAFAPCPGSMSVKSGRYNSTPAPRHAYSAARYPKARISHRPRSVLCTGGGDETGDSQGRFEGFGHGNSADRCGEKSYVARRNPNQVLEFFVNINMAAESTTNTYAIPPTREDNVAGEPKGSSITTSAMWKAI